ncbi:hypothetical protein ES708_25089 [subsurface metagenome]
MANDLIHNLLAFIQYETFWHQTNIDYLCRFIFKNYKLFTKDDLENLLKSVLHKLNVYNNGALLRTIDFAFKENNYPRISDKDLILKTLSLSKSSDRKHDTIIYLWSISDDAIKEELKQKITDNLDKKFNIDLYTTASFKKIIDFNKYFEQYISEINKTKGNGHYTLNVGKPGMQSFVFINAMIFIYSMKLRSDDKRLNVFTSLTDYMKFYLFPEKFDYKKFKAEWLYIGDREIFYERFKKNPAIRKAIEKKLKKKFEKELAEILIKYFI